MFEKLRAKFRRHDWNETANEKRLYFGYTHDPITVKYFTCKNCGEERHLNKWQMEASSMMGNYGCDGHLKYKPVPWYNGGYE